MTSRTPQKSNIGSTVAAIFFIVIIVGSVSFIWKSDVAQNWINKTFTNENTVNLTIPTPTPGGQGFDLENDEEASKSSSIIGNHMIIETSGNYMPTEAQAETAKNSVTK